jgi:hypothetical protein
VDVSTLGHCPGKCTSDGDGREESSMGVSPMA